MVITGLLYWEIVTYKQSVYELAAVEARASLNKDLVYRRWAAIHGGVYVPVTEQTQPNPFLRHVDERDIETPTGRHLTLMNPAYMTRQVYELAQKQYDVRGHITSLKPLSPANGPDDWEKTALEAFTAGQKEIQGVSSLDGEKYYRLMRPMFVEQGCLSCHGYQGYEVGDIRGGISVSVPLKNYEAIAAANVRVLTLVHVTLFLLGASGIAWAFLSLGRVEKNREKVHGELKESEEYLRAVFAAADNVAFVHTDLGGEDTKILGFSPGAEKMFGYASGEVLGRRVSLLHPEGDEKQFPALQQSLREGLQNSSGETTLVRKSGEHFPALFTIRPYFNRKGELAGTIGVSVDITLRKLFEEQLRRSEETARALLNAVTESCLLMEPDGTIITANNIAAERLGLSMEQIVGRNAYDMLPPDIRESRMKYVEEALQKKVRVQFSDQRAGMDFEHSISPILDAGGTTERVAIFARDVTLKRFAQQTLKNDLALNLSIAAISREILSDTYDINDVSLAVLNAAKKITLSGQGHISQVDRGDAAIDHFQEDTAGVNSTAGASPLEQQMPEGYCYSGLCDEILKKREPFFTNHPERYLAGSELPEERDSIRNFLGVPVMIGGRLYGMIALADSQKEYTDQDIMLVERLAEIFALGIHRKEYEGQRLSMEQNLRQLQKHEAIGALAGGIAHDFNNILSPIIGYAEFLREDLGEQNPMRESVEQIITASGRARELVKQILTFSRQQEQEIVPLKPHLVIKEAVKLVKSTLPTTISVQQRIDVNCRTILADPTQIHQVAMNLLTNAYHAMQDNGGVLTVGLENIELSGKEELELEAGPYVMLSVKDTGTGMSADVISKIFDPYFTTKPQEKGTGLGLSVVYGIAKNYHGGVAVESEPGAGSRFSVYIPAVEQETQQSAAVTGRESLRGTESIMLVDDEVAILRLVSRLLERYGYRVETFTSSRAALNELLSEPGKFDMVITDMTMPEMTGDRLTTEILKVYSNLPILICTGFSEAITPEKAEAIGARGLLMKPVTGLDLARNVRSVLDMKSHT